MVVQHDGLIVTAMQYVYEINSMSAFSLFPSSRVTRMFSRQLCLPQSTRHEPAKRLFPISITPSTQQTCRTSQCRASNILVVCLSKKLSTTHGSRLYTAGSLKKVRDADTFHRMPQHEPEPPSSLSTCALADRSPSNIKQSLWRVQYRSARRAWESARAGMAARAGVPAARSDTVQQHRSRTRI